MNGNIMMGLRRAIWRLRQRIATEITPRSRGEAVFIRPPTPETAIPEERPTLTSVEPGWQGSTEDEISDARARALELWSQGNKAAALSLLRRALRDHPQDSLLWMSLGQRLQELGNADSAYLAFTNAVEVDAGNFSALEQFIAMAHSKGHFANIEEVLSELPRAIEGRPHRYLESLDYSMPYEIDEALSIVEKCDDGLARAVVERFRGPGQEVIRQPTGRTSVATRIRVAINRDDVQEALRILPTVSQSEIPADSLRRLIRRVRSSSVVESEVVRSLITEYLRARPSETWISRWVPAEAEQEDGALLQGGYPFPPIMPYLGDSRRKNRIAYVLYNSLPYHSAGYSTRTHGLLSALQLQDWDVSGVTRLGYPHDMPGWSDVGALAPSEKVEGIRYHRLSPNPEVVRKQPIKPYVDQYVDRLSEHLRREQPFIVHAASNHLNGLAAVAAARSLGMPSIYEVRGLWEITRGSRDPVWAHGPEHRLIVRLETEAAINSTRVVTITHALKQELVRRGVAESKITVVPNGVDSSTFCPQPRDRHLAQQLDLSGRTVIGYVGSIVDYEGLGLLVEATAELAKERDDFVVLIVGDGAELENLRRMVNLTSTAKLFRFVGRVPHDDAMKYYSLIDIAPFPRLPLPVCEMVSPLKPFEAMSMEKAVLASNVAALAEIVTDDVNGLLFAKGDVGSLTRSLRRLLDDPGLRRRLAVSGRKWVQEERQWESISSELSNVYESLGARRESRPAARRKG